MTLLHIDEILVFQNIALLHATICYFCIFLSICIGQCGVTQRLPEQALLYLCFALSCDLALGCEGLFVHCCSPAVSFNPYPSFFLAKSENKIQFLISPCHIMPAFRSFRSHFNMVSLINISWVCFQKVNLNLQLSLHVKNGQVKQMETTEAD